MHARMPIGRFVVPKSAGITKVADLKGKTIGTPVIHPDPYLEGIYKEAGLDPKDIKMVATGTGAPALLALKRGDIAAWMSWDTAVAELENRGMEFIEFRPELLRHAVRQRRGDARGTDPRDNPSRRMVVVHVPRHRPRAVHFRFEPITRPIAAVAHPLEGLPARASRRAPRRGQAARRIRAGSSCRASPTTSCTTPECGEEPRQAVGRMAVPGMKEQGCSMPAPLIRTSGRPTTNEFVDQINDWRSRPRRGVRRRRGRRLKWGGIAQTKLWRSTIPESSR